MRIRLVTITLILIAFTVGLWLSAPERLERRAVRGAVEGFMSARMSRDATQARTFLTNDLHQKLTASPGFTLIGMSNPHYHTYEIADMNRESDGTWRVSVEMTEEMAGQGDSGWFEEILTVRPVQDGYRIADIQRGAYHNLRPGQ